MIRIHNRPLLVKTLLIVTGLICVIYFINIQPALGSFYIIKGANANEKIQAGFYNQDKVLEYFRQALTYGSFGYAENSMVIGNYTLTLFDNRSKVFNEDMKAVFNLAIQKISDTIEANPRDARYRAMLGMLYLKFMEYDIGAADSAKEAFEDTLSINSNRPDILFFLSKAELAMENYEEAINVLKQAIALAPNYADFNANLPIYFFMSGDIANAKETANAARKFFSKDSQTISRIEKILIFYEKYGLYEEVIPFYSDVMEIDRLNAKWPLGLMEVYLKLGNREKASEMAKKAVKLVPSLEKSLAPLMR